MADVVLRVCWKKNTKEELMEVLTGVKEIVASSNSPQNKSLRKTKFETKLNFKAKFKLQGEPGEPRGEASQDSVGTLFCEGNSVLRTCRAVRHVEFSREWKDIIAPSASSPSLLSSTTIIVILQQDRSKRRVQKYLILRI
jgi:hypothetical protein